MPVRMSSCWTSPFEGRVTPSRSRPDVREPSDLVAATEPIGRRAGPTGQARRIFPVCPRPARRAWRIPVRVSPALTGLIPPAVGRVVVAIGAVVIVSGRPRDEDITVAIKSVDAIRRCACTPARTPWILPVGADAAPASRRIVVLRQDRRRHSGEQTGGQCDPNSHDCPLTSSGAGHPVHPSRVENMMPTNPVDRGASLYRFVTRLPGTGCHGTTPMAATSISTPSCSGVDLTGSIPVCRRQTISLARSKRWRPLALPFSPRCRPPTRCSSTPWKPTNL
ncbi:hypothetical protein BH09PSE1_BH09PSE1_17070 [soil metagenome]